MEDPCPACNGSRHSSRCGKVHPQTPRGMGEALCEQVYEREAPKEVMNTCRD